MASATLLYKHKQRNKKAVDYSDSLYKVADFMQFNLEKNHTKHIVQRCQSHSVRVSGVEYRQSFILLPHGIIEHWPVDSIDALSVDLLQAVVASNVEVFLLGTGLKQHFPHLSLMHALAQYKRSVDVMDNAAACRTYNVLAGEYRTVGLGVILP